MDKYELVKAEDITDAEFNNAHMIVQFFQTAYPNTDFTDTGLSAGAWAIMLHGQDFDLAMRAARRIVARQENGYKVNIAALLNEIKEIKKEMYEENQRKEFLRMCEESEKNKASPEHIEKLLKEFRENKQANL